MTRWRLDYFFNKTPEKMIDTIKIKISEYIIKDRNFFNESFNYDKGSGFWMDTRTNNKYRQSLIKKGQYVPKFSIEKHSKGKGVIVLELSLPKLLFGTNLQEITENDFDAVLENIQKFLLSISVEVEIASIANAIVTMVAYSKNVNLTPLGTANEIIKILSKFDYRPRSDYYFFTNFNNKQDGYGLRYSNESVNFTIYDKIAEIISHPQTLEEKQIASYYANKTLSSTGIIRLEFTLRNKTAVKQALSKSTGISKKDYTLAEVYNKAISKILLTEEITKIFDNLMVSNIINLDWQEITKIAEKRNYPTYYQESSLRCAIMDIQQIGYNNFRKKYIFKNSRTSWSRLKKELDFIFNGFKSSYVLKNYTIEEIIYYINSVL